MKVDRAVYQDAHRWVAYDLGYDITYSKWGQEAARQRTNAVDPQVSEAVKLLHQADTPAGLFTAAEPLEPKPAAVEGRSRVEADLTLAALLALAGLGLVVGFVAGLVGIGGGVITVPFLYFFYSHAAFSGTTVTPALQPAMAHATSLFVIIPTAVMGTYTYHRLGAVVWRAAVPVALFSTVAAVAGSRIAPLLQPALLKVGFGMFLLFTPQTWHCASARRYRRRCACQCRRRRSPAWPRV